MIGLWPNNRHLSHLHLPNTLTAQPECQKQFTAPCLFITLRVTKCSALTYNKVFLVQLHGAIITALRHYIDNNYNIEC